VVPPVTVAVPLSGARNGRQGRQNTDKRSQGYSADRTNTPGPGPGPPPGSPGPPPRPPPGSRPATAPAAGQPARHRAGRPVPGRPAQLPAGQTPHIVRSAEYPRAILCKVLLLLRSLQLVSTSTPQKHAAGASTRSMRLLRRDLYRVLRPGPAGHCACVTAVAARRRACRSAGPGPRARQARRRRRRWRRLRPAPPPALSRTRSRPTPPTPVSDFREAEVIESQNDGRGGSPRRAGEHR